jgi:uncharacterized membrane protein YjjB (DUF3815 family)
MKILGAFLLICGLGIALGYLLYWFFCAVADFIPIPLKVAIGAAAVGLLLLIFSIIRERRKASKDEESLREVQR